jgi:hypothetical protein
MFPAFTAFLNLIEYILQFNFYIHVSLNSYQVYFFLGPHVNW